jgi:hypothetical protein
MLNKRGDFFMKKEFESDTLIKGRMTSSRLEGFIYGDPDGLIRLSFTAEEEEGSLALEPYIVSLDIKLFEDRPESPTAIFESELIVPKAKEINRLRDSVLIRAFSAEGKNIKMLSPNQVLQQQADTFFSNYQTLSDYDSLPAHALQWLKSIEVGILMNQENLLCIETSEYVYSGGAHGMLNRLFYVFDSKSGRQLKAEDVFLPQSDSALTELLTTAIKARYEINSDSSLTSFGLFVEVVEPSDNFWLSNTGIGFYYNSYELAPYSYGQSDLFLPFELLKGLLNKDLKQRLGL